MIARRMLAAALMLLLAACGRRAPLRLPERDGGESAPPPTPAPAREPQRRGPSPAGLETG